MKVMRESGPQESSDLGFRNTVPGQHRPPSRLSRHSGWQTVGVLVAVFSAVGALVMVGSTESSSTATVPDSVFTVVPPPTWVDAKDFVSTGELLPEKRTRSDPNVVWFLDHARAGYDFWWPTAAELGFAIEPFATENTLDRYPNTDTPYVALSPSQWDEGLGSGGGDWPRSQPRWTGATDVLMELTRGAVSMGSLDNVISCLQLNGFTSCRVDDSTALAGCARTVVRLTVSAGDQMVDCDFIEPQAALRMAADSVLTGCNVRATRVSMLDRATIAHLRGWGSGPDTYYQGRCQLRTLPFRTFPKPWVRRFESSQALVCSTPPCSTLNDGTEDHSSQMACPKPSWLETGGPAQCAHDTTETPDPKS